MATAKTEIKKLISLTSDTTKLRDAIFQTSLRTGLTESRIIEDCIICGFAFLYGNEEDIPETLSIMKKRYGNIVDIEKLKNFLQKDLQQS